MDKPLLMFNRLRLATLQIYKYSSVKKGQYQVQIEKANKLLV